MKIDDIELLKEVYTIYDQEIIKGTIVSKRIYLQEGTFSFIFYPLNRDKNNYIECEVGIHIRALGYPSVITRTNKQIYTSKEDLLKDLKENSSF